MVQAMPVAVAAALTQRLAVIGGHDDESVFEQSARLELFKETTKLVVEVSDAVVVGVACQLLGSRGHWFRGHPQPVAQVGQIGLVRGSHAEMPRCRVGHKIGIVSVVVIQKSEERPAAAFAREPVEDFLIDRDGILAIEVGVLPVSAALAEMSENVAAQKRASEDLDGNERNVLVVHKPATEAVPSAAKVSVGDEARCSVTVIPEELGEGWMGRIQRAIDPRGKLVRPAPREHAGV